jgi:hypothetical protein
MWGFGKTLKAQDAEDDASDDDEDGTACALEATCHRSPLFSLKNTFPIPASPPAVMIVLPCTNSFPFSFREIDT